MYTQGVDADPPILIPSGGHPNMNGWQAGDIHPTGMLSCYN